MTNLFRLGAVASAVMVFAASASGVTLRFGGVSDNDADDTSTGEEQLTIDLFSPTVGPVRGSEGSVFVGFLIKNPGPGQSTITSVYFDDGTILGLAQIIDDPENGVDFDQPVTPPNLPGGEELDPAFEATQAFSVGNEPGVANGVDVGEELTLVFELLPGLTFEDTVQALLDGTLRIGLHVQNFPGGGSESFVNLPPEVVPLPASAGLAMLGLGAVATRRRRA